MMPDRLSDALENSARPPVVVPVFPLPRSMDGAALPLRQGPLAPGLSADLFSEKYSASANFSVIMVIILHLFFACA
jgi:hypothetical protein